MEQDVLAALRELTAKVDRLLAESRPAYTAQPTLLNLPFPKKSRQLDSPRAIYEYVRKAMEDLPQEHGVVLCLNAKLYAAHVEVVSKGTANATLLYPRDVFRVAVQQNASAIVLVHCHPSGDPTPSEEDLKATQNLYKASRLLDIPIVDHLVVGREGYVSLKEQCPYLFR
ncbi:DNA repair protein RadC [Candidatus Poribacteria bacterium]|nr:DNA repair protein RadC [Candidatus Poribacteria bacterium]